MRPSVDSAITSARAKPSGVTDGENSAHTISVVLLSPSIMGSPGGIARYAEGLLTSRVMRDHRYVLNHLTTHKYGSKARKLTLALAAAARVVPWSRRASIAHALVGSDASCVRKLALLTEARLCGMRTFAHLHGSSLVEWLQSLAPRWRDLIIRLIDRCDAVATLGNRLADYLRGHGLSTLVRVIPNGVHSTPTRRPSTSHAPVILFAGTLGARKGTPELLRAFAQLSERHPEAKLVLMGDGMIDQARQLASELGIARRIECTGWAKSDDVGRAMEQASMFVLPSHHEGMALSVLEAMMRGLPVIATPVGEHRTVIEDTRNGLFVPAGNVAELRDAMDRLLLDRSLADRLGHAAREKALEEFEISANHERVAAVYDALSGQTNANAIHRS